MTEELKKNKEENKKKWDNNQQLTEHKEQPSSTHRHKHSNKIPHTCL